MKSPKTKSHQCSIDGKEYEPQFFVVTGDRLMRDTYHEMDEESILYYHLKKKRKPVLLYYPCRKWKNSICWSFVNVIYIFHYQKCITFCLLRFDTRNSLPFFYSNRDVSRTELRTPMEGLEEEPSSNGLSGTNFQQLCLKSLPPRFFFFFWKSSDVSVGQLKEDL